MAQAPRGEEQRDGEREREGKTEGGEKESAASRQRKAFESDYHNRAS